MATTVNLDQVREDVRYRLAGLTYLEIVRAAGAARISAEVAQTTVARWPGCEFAAEDAARTATAYEEHRRIWNEMRLNRKPNAEGVYDPTV